MALGALLCPWAAGAADVIQISVVPASARMSGEEIVHLKERAAAAQAEAERLQKAVEAQFGRDAARWPADGRARLDRLTQVGDTLGTQALCANTEKQELAETLDALAGSLEDRLATTSPRRAAVTKDQAAVDLVVEVVGRNGTMTNAKSPKHVCLDVRPGPRGTGGLGRLKKDWDEALVRQFGDRLLVAHHYRADEPFIRFRVTDEQRWRDVADWGAHVVASFIEQNQDALAATP